MKFQELHQQDKIRLCACLRQVMEVSLWVLFKRGTCLLTFFPLSPPPEVCFQVGQGLHDFVPLSKRLTLCLNATIAELLSFRGQL